MIKSLYIEKNIIENKTYIMNNRKINSFRIYSTINDKLLLREKYLDKVTEGRYWYFSHNNKINIKFPELGKPITIYKWQVEMKKIKIYKQEKCLTINYYKNMAYFFNKSIFIKKKIK